MIKGEDKKIVSLHSKLRLDIGEQKKLLDLRVQFNGKVDDVKRLGEKVAVMKKEIVDKKRERHRRQGEGGCDTQADLSKIFLMSSIRIKSYSMSRTSCRRW